MPQAEAGRELSRCRASGVVVWGASWEEVTGQVGMLGESRLTLTAACLGMSSGRILSFRLCRRSQSPDTDVISHRFNVKGESNYCNCLTILRP